MFHLMIMEHCSFVEHDEDGILNIDSVIFISAVADILTRI